LECHEASKHHLLEFGFFLDSINLGFLLRENSLLYSSYLPLGVPNWTVIYIITTTLSNDARRRGVVEDMVIKSPSRRTQQDYASDCPTD
jgi:hypothetical protein